MHRRRFIQAAATVTFATTGQRVSAQPDTPLAAALRERVRHEGVGLVAAVVDGKSTTFAAAGRRTAAGGAGPDADARFEIGSITKTFTALLLAEMAVRKVLSLDEPVESALGGPKLRDAAGQPITWADLATHRSGLPRLPTNLSPRDEADPYADYRADDLMAFIANWKPEVARDTRWEYSNLGFGLLGHALGLRVGRPYAELLRERVLAPLQLEGLRLAIAPAGADGLLPGHDAQRQPVPRWQFDALAGAGAIIATPREMAVYAQAALGIQDHPLAEAFRLALTPRATGPVPANPIGLAWILAPLNGRQVAVHDGGTFGFSSSIVLDPAHRRGAVVLANCAVPVNDLAVHALDPAVPTRDAAAEATQTQRPAAAVPADALAVLTGTYALNPQFKVTLRRRDGRLFAQATGQGEFELFALDRRRFFARVTALEIHFDGADGVPPGFELLQGGQRLRFVRE